MSDDLSTIFHALADPTRRAILERLAECDLTVGEVAEPFEMTFQAVSRHLKVLESAGLVVRGRDAQWRTAGLDPRPLQAAQSWTNGFEHFWRQQSTAELSRGRGAGTPEPSGRSRQP